MNKCPVCDAEIPEERFELGYTTCIKHSSARPKVGFMVFSHKTAPKEAIKFTIDFSKYAYVNVNTGVYSQIYGRTV